MICRYFPTICAHVRGVFSAEPYLLLRLGIQQVLGQRFSAYYKNDLEKVDVSIHDYYCSIYCFSSGEYEVQTFGFTLVIDNQRKKANHLTSESPIM